MEKAYRIKLMDLTLRKGLLLCQWMTQGRFKEDETGIVSVHG